MPKLNIRKGDRVKVISGNYKGQEGTVLRVEPDKSRVVVDGVNRRKRHMKPSQTNPEGGIVEFEAPIHVSNVMLLDPASGEPTRVRREAGADGRRERVAVRSGRVIPRA
ncbi:MAG TPA: 50S ribosomal protein L24 [Longimicrobium sp.]|jgi:large subunit ribosomal protein L24|uniref:50S ribosomal protein L24 n=1 Tax=Longimicrobium sp. TaxID=2029185 RepID=UPI002EDA3FAF